MPLPLAPIFIAGATAGIGTFFQIRAEKIARARDLREAELNRAREIYQELSESMDQVYYYLMHRAMGVAVRKALGDETQKEVDAEHWHGYGQAVTQWMTNQTRFDVGVRHYFGEENHRRLKVIQHEFKTSGKLVGATYQGKPHGVVKDGKADTADFFQAVESLEAHLLELGEQMTREIQHQNVGRLRKKRQ